MSCRFSYRMQPKAIVIIDENGISTVTNYVDEVLRVISSQIRPKKLDDFVIVYRDSKHIWDGIKTKDNKFYQFEILMCYDEEQAIKYMSDLSSKPKRNRFKKYLSKIISNPFKPNKL